jgi:hypothetical protein
MAYDPNLDGQNPTDPTQPATPTPGIGSPQDAIKTYYQQALGRAPESDDVINQWLKGSGGDLGKAQQLIYATPEAQAYSKAQTAKGSAAASAASPSGMPDGIDPRLAALYQKAGMTPGGEGSGFADWKYWQDKASQSGNWDYFLSRLGADLAGTGTDQPTGTPGQGAWSGSGAADRAAGASGTPPPPGSTAVAQGPTGFNTNQTYTPPPAAALLSPPPAYGPAPPGYSATPSPTGAPTLGLPSPAKGYGPDAGNAGNFWQGRTPMDFSSQKVASSPLADQSNDLIKALIARINLSGNGLNFNK